MYLRRNRAIDDHVMESYTGEEFRSQSCLILFSRHASEASRSKQSKMQQKSWHLW